MSEDGRAGDAVDEGGEHPPVDVVFGSLTPPELLAGGGALAEELGFAELWFSEDCFFTGAMSGMTQLLASTSAVPVRLGLASTVTRHPALLAMELAGLARMYPGRVSATLGLGNVGWLEQLGLLPRRPLTTLLDDHAQLSRLLAGDQVSGGAGHVFRDVRLGFPPALAPPLWLGAVNARALRAAGGVADGVLLSVLSGPSYVRWACAQVRAGAKAAGRPAPPVVAFALTSVDPDAARARADVADAVAFFAEAEQRSALVSASPFSPDDVRRLLRGDRSGIAPLIEEFAAAGDARHVAAHLDALLDAGADRVGLWLFPTAAFEEQLTVIARDVLPLVHRRQ